MREMNGTVTQQLQQLQTLMHRMAFHGFTVDGKAARNPYRGQGRVLSLLKRKPEISQKELTTLLDMSKQSLAELLAKLEKSGYISREPSQADKRSITVRLLEEGKRAAEEMDERDMEVFQIFDCLEDTELEQFGGYLERIIKRCAEYFPGEDIDERRQRMENFLAKYDHSFTRFDESNKHGHKHDHAELYKK